MLQFSWKLLIDISSFTAEIFPTFCKALVSLSLSLSLSYELLLKGNEMIIQILMTVVPNDDAESLL